MATFTTIRAKRTQNTFGKLAKRPVACFVRVVSQAIIFLQWLYESEFKSIPYKQHKLRLGLLLCVCVTFAVALR